MKHKKIVLTFLLLACLALTAFPAQAAIDAGNWNTPTFTGQWGPLEPTEGFNAPYNGSQIGQLQTNYDPIYNFSAFWLNVTVDQIQSKTDASIPYDNTWQENQKKVSVDLKLLSNLYGVNGQYYVMCNSTILGEDARNAVNIDGVSDKFLVKVGNKAFWDGFQDVQPMNYSIYLLKDSNTTLRVCAGYFNRGGETTFPNGTKLAGFFVWYNQTFQVPSGFFETWIIPQLTVSHEGSGSFRLFIDGHDYNNGDFPNIIGGMDADKFIKEVTGVFGTFGDMINFVLMIWGFIIGAVTFVVAMVQAFWPIFPLIAIVYLIDLFWTSYQRGSFTGIGDTFYKLYTMFTTAAQTAIAVAQAVIQAATGAIGWILGLFGIVI